MSTAVMTKPIAEHSPRSKARAAGAFWLITILTSTFAYFASGRFVVSGDAAAGSIRPWPFRNGTEFLASV